VGVTESWEAAEETRDMVDWQEAGNCLCRRGDCGGRERESGDREDGDLFWE